MAKNNSPYTIASRGSVKGVIFSSAFGVDYFKTRPETIANPRTPKQVSQRLALSLITATWQQIEAFGNIAYKKRAVGMSAYNQFAKQNLSQSKMDIDLVTNVATWLPAILEVKANPSQQGNISVLVTGGNATVSLSSFAPSRSFTVYSIAQAAIGFLGAVVKNGVTTNSSGVATFTVLTSDYGLPDWSAIYFSTVDSINGGVSNFTAIV